MRRIIYCLIVVFVVCLLPQTTHAQTSGEWYMAGANPQRTSWLSPAQPDLTGQLPNGGLNVEWYVPLEPYIDQKVQLITANDKVYVSTAKGLYVFNYQNGQLAWRFNTELPLGHSPTVIGNKVYVAGHDKRVYRLQDNGTSYQVDWIFDEALSGFNTNPLVVNNTVYIGNRSGVFYAINANTGAKIWQYPSPGARRLGEIKFSAAYDSTTNTVFFAASDDKAYALDASTSVLSDAQRLKWSKQLLGDGFSSYWPVVTGNNVVFSGSASYMEDFKPGTLSVTSSSQQMTNSRVSAMQVMDVFQVYLNTSTQPYSWVDDLTGATTGIDGVRTIGDQVPSRNWIAGQSINYIRPWRMLEYLEDNPNSNSVYFNNPWRREVFVLNKQTGTEFTFDSDNDGHPEYAPLSHWNAGSGAKFPVLVDPNGIIYNHSLYRCCSDSKGQIMTWNPADPGYVGIIGSINGFLGAIAEPQGFAGNGNSIYRTICCDRALTRINVQNGSDATIKPYGGNQGYNQYNSIDMAPGYDANWMIWNGIDRLRGFYQGYTDRYVNSTVDEIGKDVKSVNGIYHNHGSEQNPPIPYKGKLFIHRSNAILAIGPGSPPPSFPSPPPTLRSAPPDTQGTPNHPLTDTQIQSLLDEEMQKMVEAGVMRPGYSVLSQWYANFAAYAFPYENPGETLYTLALAYPHLSATRQSQVATLADTYYQQFFVTTPTSKIGWYSGAKREAMPDPPEFSTGLPGNTTGSIPFENEYALYLYAKNILAPRGASTSQLQALYTLASNRISSAPTPSYNTQAPSELNKVINGYVGFMRLHEWAQTQGLTVNTTNYNTASTRYQTAINLRNNNFRTNNGYFDPAAGLSDINRIHFNVAANFMYMTPDLGNAMEAISTQVTNALAEYEQVAPFWFVSKFESFKQEGTIQHIFTPPALFQARAYILNQPKSELVKYIDAPYYDRGDLYYIQNLVAVLNAPGSGGPSPTPQPSPLPGDANGDGTVNLADIHIWFTNYGQSGGIQQGNFNGDTKVNLLDFGVWVMGFGN